MTESLEGFQRTFRRYQRRITEVLEVLQDSEEKRHILRLLKEMENLHKDVVRAAVKISGEAQWYIFYSKLSLCMILYSPCRGQDWAVNVGLAESRAEVGSTMSPFGLLVCQGHWCQEWHLQRSENCFRWVSPHDSWVLILLCVTEVDGLLRGGFSSKESTPVSEKEDSPRKTSPLRQMSPSKRWLIIF